MYHKDQLVSMSKIFLFKLSFLVVRLFKWFMLTGHKVKIVLK